MLGPRRRRLAVDARPRHVRDAHHVARRAAVHEEALDGARQVALVRVPVDVEELVPPAEQHRLVERTLRRQPHEARDAGIRHRERLGARLVGGGIYAGGPNLSHRSHCCSARSRRFGAPCRLAALASRARIPLTVIRSLIVVRSLLLFPLTALPGFVDLFIDPCNLTQPDMPLVVLHVQNVVERPVKVIRDIGYLLVNLLQGVACYPPWPAGPPPPSRSTSNSVWHEGHLA